MSVKSVKKALEELQGLAYRNTVLRDTADEKQRKDWGKVQDLAGKAMKELDRLACEEENRAPEFRDWALAGN